MTAAARHATILTRPSAFFTGFARTPAQWTRLLKDQTLSFPETYEELLYDQVTSIESRRHVACLPRLRLPSPFRERFWCMSYGENRVYLRYSC
jgi:hypothetical protein